MPANLAPAPASWWRRGWSGALAAGVLLASAPFVPVSSATGVHESKAATQSVCDIPANRAACASDAPFFGSGTAHGAKPNANAGTAPRPALRSALAAGQPLDCSGATIYAVQRGSSTSSNGALLALTASTITSSTVTATVVSNIPGAGFANALGVARGGSAAYVVDQVPANDGAVNVYGYNASTGAWTTYTGTAGSGDDFVAGAVDPANGIYYYASYSSGTSSSPGEATVYGFAGHVNWAGMPPFAFGRLAFLRTGDLVYTADAHGAQTAWRVIDVTARAKTAGVDKAGFAGTAGRRLLALITCGGGYDSSSSSYEDNVYAYAVPA